MRFHTFLCSSLPYILNANSTLTVLGALSLNTLIMSRKSSKVRSPSPLEEKTSQMRSLNGLTLKIQRDTGYRWPLKYKGTMDILDLEKTNTKGHWISLTLKIQRDTGYRWHYGRLPLKKIIVNRFCWCKIIALLTEVFILYSSYAIWIDQLYTKMAERYGFRLKSSERVKQTQSIYQTITMPICWILS